MLRCDGLAIVPRATMVGLPAALVQFIGQPACPWSTLQGEVSVSVQLLRADTRSQVIDGHTRKGFVSRSARGTAAGRFLVRLSRNWKLTDLNTSP